jgi:phage terminase small subunit
VLQNKRWEEFAQAYAVSHNATQAALKAGFSPPSAGRLGYKLLQKDEVNQRVREIVSTRWKKIHMDGDEILARLSRLARVDIRDVMTDDGTLLDPKSLTDQGAAAIAGLEVLEQFEGNGKAKKKVGTVTKVKLRDPTAALRMLAEMHKLLRAPGEGADALAGAIAERMQQRRTVRADIIEAKEVEDKR